MPSAQTMHERTRNTANPPARKRKGKEPADAEEKTKAKGTRTAGQGTGEKTLLQRLETGLWGLGVLALALLVLLALASYHPGDVDAQENLANWIGPLGAWVAYLLYSAFGLPAYLLAGFLVYVGTMVVIGQMLAIRPRILLALLLVLLPTQVLLQILLPGTDYFPQGGGGALGAGMDSLFEMLLARTGTVLVAVVVLLTWLQHGGKRLQL